VKRVLPERSPHKYRVYQSVCYALGVVP
jgi:hypothetical protein